MWSHVIDWPVRSCLHDWSQGLCPWWCKSVADVCRVKRSTPPFFILLFGSSLFPLCGDLPFFCSPVLCFFSLLDDLTSVQLKFSSRLSSQAFSLSQSVQIHVMSVFHLLSPVSHSFSGHSEQFDWGLRWTWKPVNLLSMQVFFLVFFIQLQIKVLWDNATVTVCLWFLRDTTAFALLLFTGNGCRETKSGPVGRLNFRARRAVYGFVWIWTNWSETDFILHASFLRSTLAREMNKFYSMQTVEPEDGTKVRESFKFVSEVKGEVKRDVWREDGGQERSEPSCCLSVSKISYTVR